MLKTRMPFSNENRVYIGNLARGCRERDVEKFFQGFGRIEEMMFKGTYAFIVSKIGPHFNETAYVRL